jgi:organic hydroperoxide reductase OsmC/OhrA
MSEHRASVRWSFEGSDFRRGKFSRKHEWRFDGGVTLPASSSPSVVPAPWSDPAAVDPEEAFVASISSCHLLTFVWLCSRAGHEVLSYQDDAVGTMTKNERGVPWISRVELHPRIVYKDGTAPTAAQEAELHHHAHEQCFVAQSVKTEIVVV